jgi:purine-binding chemotaxis protein CheW
VSAGYLLVRADRRPYGLPLAHVVEVADLTEVLDVPRTQRAMRGLTAMRGRLVPLVHLGALLGDRTPPPERGGAVVLVQVATGELALEVDDAEEVVRSAALPLPDDQSLPWAAGVAARAEGLVPILDLESLGERFA